MTTFLDRKFERLEAYTPGEQPKDMHRLMKLNTNEFPYPPPAGVLDVVNREELEKLRLYSDPECRVLIEAIADYCGVKPECVFPGNGSDEVLAFLFHGFCPNGAAFPDISYGFYKVFAQMFGVSARQVPLREDFSIAVDDYAGLRETVFIANPNAPTGLCLPLNDIETLLRQDPSRLVVIDEAYVEFGGEIASQLIGRYENLIVTRTFSKSHALAGARLGYALANQELIADLNTLRFSFNPYNVNRLSILLGAAAMREKAYFIQKRATVMQSREFITAKLRNMGFTVPESRANFIFAGANPALGGAEYYKRLRENGILVRHFDQPRIQDWVRITIGPREQMEILAETTEKILAGEA